MGGSSGLGRGTALALAKMNPKSIVIASRNETKAQLVIDEMNAIHPEGIYSFQKVDLTRIQDIHRFATVFKSSQDSLNGLVLTAGIMTLDGRQETEEGVDREMATHYYGRLALIQELMPLLVKSAENSNPLSTRVVTVLAGAGGGWIVKDDLALKNHYSFLRARLVAAAYNDMMVKKLADLYPKIMFNHIFPGLVDTPLVNGLPFPIPQLAGIFAPLLMKKATDVGEMVAYTCTSNDYTRNSNLVGESGQILKDPSYITPEMTDVVWNHGLKTVREALVENIEK